ncbi:MAG: alpha/beta hydrolase [Chloroflexia bacterium]
MSTATNELDSISYAGNSRGWPSLGRTLGVVGLGAVSLVFGGIPFWAARRIIYPVFAEPLPQGLDETLQVAEGARPEKVEFTGLDGHKLEGWFVPGPDSSSAPWPVVLLAYGYGGYKEQMVGYAGILHSGGFATMMFDMPGSGRRRGQPVTLGFRERWDLIAAARYLRSRPDVDRERIGVLGVSMGAATALLAAADEPSIKAIVSDSAYADLTEMVKPGIKAFLGLPSFPFAPIIARYAEVMIGAKASDIVPKRAAAHLGDRPVFIIHGEDDNLVAPDSAHKIFAEASGPKELWMVPDCPHGQAPAVRPEEYKERVNNFFSRWLTAGPASQLSALSSQV